MLGLFQKKKITPDKDFEEKAPLSLALAFHFIFDGLPYEWRDDTKCRCVFVLAVLPTECGVVRRPMRV